MSRIVCACHYYPESLCPENEMTDQLKALRLADRLEGRWALHPEMQEAAAELRRQHDQIERLAAEVANRNRRALAGDEAVAGLANVHAYYEAIEAERDAAVKVLTDVGVFLDHCWRDVPMNDFSFEWLERMITTIDAARGKT